MLSQILLVLLMFMGGCAGSTGGGMKVIRVLILMKAGIHAVKKAASPRSVLSVKTDGKKVEETIVRGVLAYFVVYMLFMAASILIISLDNKDFATTVTSVISVMNNIGTFGGWAFGKLQRILNIIENRNVDRYACGQT